MAKMFYSQFVMFVYDLHDHKLCNTARLQEPAFHKASDLTMIPGGALRIHMIIVWKRSSIEPIEILTRWWSNMYRFETAFCHTQKIIDSQVLVHGLRLSEYQ